MPNILKRPMFRKGGSVAYGTGITSGLEERRNYSTGAMGEDGVMIGEMGGIGKGGVVEELIEDPTRKLTKEEADKIALSRLEREANQPIIPEIDPRKDDVLQQMGIMSAIEGTMKPTTGEVIDDTMAAIASTAPDDPTKLQTFGQVLGKAGAAARGLEKEREKSVREFRKEAGLQILKNMTSQEKDQLFRYAKKYAETTGIPVEEAYKIFLNRYLQGTPSKGLTKERLFQANLDRVAGSRKARNLTMGEQQTVADVLTKMQTDSSVPKAGIISRNAFKSKKGAVDAGAEVGMKYINPQDGGIYTYDGDGKFTKIWPSK